MSLKELLYLKLKALYDIETQIVRALPMVVKKVSDINMKRALSDHLKETRNQVLRLSKIFSLLKVRAAKTKVEAIRGLIKDTEWLMQNIKPRAALDAALLTSLQYVEHYEMAGYAGAREWALLSGENIIASILEETLEEEKGANEKLSMIADETVNKKISQ